MKLRDLYTELRRRRVFRVTGIYGIVAWIVVQVAATTFPVLMLPDWSVRLVIALFLLGLPVVVVLAWLFDITPGGVARTPSSGEAARADAPVMKPAPAVRRLAAWSAVLLLAAAAAGFYHYGPGERHSGTGSAPDGVVDRSIAVLPFADFSPNADQQWFSDGLAEEILNALARVPDVRVASRTESFQFRAAGGQVRAIADSLGVAHVLEGSIRREGDRIRVSAQVIRAADSERLWAQTFERETRDVMRMQEEIAYEIARTLQTALRPEELARMVETGTNSLAAYEAFLQHGHLWHRASKLEDWSLVEQGVRELERAVQHDPRFFRARAELAFYWMNELVPTNRSWTEYGIAYAERHRLAREHLSAAEAVAPDPLSRLRVERLRARLELRLRDAVELGQRIAEMSATGEDWFLLGIDAVAIGRYDDARRWFAAAAQRPHELLRGRATLVSDYHRVDAVAAAAIVDELLTGGSAALNDLYQSHRALLSAGRTADARRVADEYLARSPLAEARLLLEVRQLCAEGRRTEAEAIIAAADASLLADPATRWHLLSYLGRREEAAEALRPYDDAGELFTLGSFLRYTFFDSAPFPNLTAVLRRNGALRTQHHDIPYACPPAQAEVTPAARQN